MEDNEHEAENKRVKDRSPSPGVKSTAVVKYTAFQSPVSYSRLQCNTDLNLPPSNWGTAIDSYGLKEILTKGTGLSSFRMAHMFPDCVGQVDVISGAECIKKLLKLPYQPNGTVSMMVHRVENTLLLDDFDVYDYLMKSEWSWLKDFFYENILKTMSEKEQTMLMLAPPQSTALQWTNKFLSHSVAALPPKLPHHPEHTPICLTGPHLPEPEIRAQEPPNEHLYNRNVLWTFEDIHMLIGSDLPIFGDKDRPCVSLRLRDAKEPINVLTGIDFWLDNLMCNVPEVLMCYHLDGIVQKYEPMKTEDLPNMENSTFSPKVIRNVAQNILSFLKSNATKAGHTYWLFKGPHDDVVKLYDLTSLCPDSLDNPFTTPVAMLLYRVARNMRLTNRSKHVRQLLENAIELLKVERYPQMVASSHYMLADLYVPATTNPASPDFKDENAESDTDDIEFECEPDCGSDRDIDRMESEGDSSNALAIQIRGLTVRGIGDRVRDSRGDEKRKARFSRGVGPGLEAGLGTEPPVRCGRALRHALRGLRALHYVTIDKCKEEERERMKEQIIIEEQHPKMANPYEPIKMDYEPLQKKAQKIETKEHNSRSRRKKRDRKASEKTEKCLVETANSNRDKNAILIHRVQNLFPSLNEPNGDDNFAWKLHLKTLLYEKICLAYATLAEYSYSNEQYGFSLKYIEMASKCQKLLGNMIIKSKVVDATCLLGRVGDNYFQLSKNWGRLEQFKKQLETDHDTDAGLRAEIENDLAEEIEGSSADDFDFEVSIPGSEVESMERSCQHYQEALSATRGRRGELLRRLASVRNELAVRHMHHAQQIYIKYADAEDPKDSKAKILLKQFNTLSQKSWDCLEEATKIFEEVEDTPNLVLLLSNKGRYMRFKAHCDQGEFNSHKRALYRSAEELYRSALRMLGEADGGGEDAGADGNASSLRQLVLWELSCLLYTRAVLMHNQHNAKAIEVADAFKYALKHCVLSAGPRQYLYQFRAAMIYHRLGSLYHAQYRSTEEEGPKRRTLLNLTRTNYEQSANIFAQLEDTAMFLTVQMQHVAAMEMQAEVSPNLKLKSLQSAIQLLRQSHSIIKVIHERDPEEQKDMPKPEEGDERSLKSEHSLLSLFENRFHFILKSVIQYCRSKTNKDYEKLTDLYKKMYSVSLKIRRGDDVQLYAGSICDVLTAMDEIDKEFV